MAGVVYSETKKLDKAGIKLPDDAPLEIKAKKDHPWVSRGGVKLAHALKHFNIAVKGFTAADIGASTGGFTDVLLTNGAAKVFAVDVGYGELAWKIQKDPRVVVLDRTNAR
ncbi:MAG: TlyA family rRNA (cytidine-2'-O)-methyltransferase, partial [Proteobacteria bacterium]|nr:TlyA family rRNA (cytidine-2'-O)-methyltransferase [Pseudomonadota bacterium]